MSVERWSDDILIAELQDDPALSDDLTTLLHQLTDDAKVHVALNLASVGYLNSSNIAKLLKVRKQVVAAGRRLVLCGISANVWGVFLVTGLDKVFDFTDDVATSLASLQLDEHAG